LEADSLDQVIILPRKHLFDFFKEKKNANQMFFQITSAPPSGTLLVQVSGPREALHGQLAQVQLATTKIDL
jgi:hypothetical protein